MMDSLVFKGKQSVSLQKKPIPKVKDNEVLVKIILTGICGTDINIYRGNFIGKPGVTLGHEATGIVSETGKGVTGFKTGDRVIIDPTMWCADCYYCRLGDTHLCDNKSGTEVGVDYDGSFAEYMVIPERFLYLAYDLTWKEAVLVEPLACVINNFEASKISYYDDVLIIGAGPIGAIAAMLSNKIARKTLVVEPNKERAKIVRELGYQIIDEKLETGVLSKKIQDNFDGRKPSVILDTSSAIYDTLLSLINKGGRVVLMGFNKNAKMTFSPLYIVNNAISIIGAGDYHFCMQRSIDVIKTLPIENILTNVYPLDNAVSVFENALFEKGLKVAFAPNGDDYE